MSDSTLETEVGPVRRSPLKSMRWRIQLWHAAILAVVVIVFAAVTWWHQQRTAFNRIDDELAAAVEVLHGQLRSAPEHALVYLVSVANEATPQQDSSGVRHQADQLVTSLTTPGTFSGRRYRRSDEEPYFCVFTVDGNVICTSRPERQFSLPDDWLASGNSTRPIKLRNLRDYRECYRQGPAGTVVMTGRFIRPDMEDIRALLLLLVFGGVVVFGAGVIGGWVLSARSLAPIQDMTLAAAEISETNLSRRIDVTETDSELADLATTLNESFARLEAAFARQREFTANASHELRTPLSVLQMHQDLALSQQRSPEEYRDAIATCQAATERMTSLTEALLTLARLDSSDLPLQVDAVSITPLIRDAIREIEPLAKAAEITVEFSDDAGVLSVLADVRYLRQVLANLLGNAVAYCAAGDRVSVSAWLLGEVVAIRVSDDGPGIAPEHLDHLFERFYRVDRDRSREHGGSGLGLSICRSIVESHGGEISVESTRGAGTTFIFTVPVTEFP